jgi:hypothetical protein
MADTLKVVKSEVNVSQLEKHKQGTEGKQRTDVYVDNLELRKRQVEKQKAEAKEVEEEQAQAEAQYNKEKEDYIKAQVDFELKHVKLDNGEWITREEYDKLPPEEQAKIKEMGVEAFNVYYNKKVIAEAGYTELANKEYILTSDYDKLPPEEQAKLNEIGIEKFNSWYSDKKSGEAGYTKLTNGEWVSTVEFNKLSAEDQARLNELGIAEYNKVKDTEFETAKQAAIIAATPKVVPISQGSGKWAGQPGSYFIRLPKGDMPAWMFIPDFQGAYVMSGSELATSYGPSISGVRMPAGSNLQEYKLTGWGYASMGEYPKYAYKWQDQNGKTYWIGTGHTSGSGRMIEASDVEVFQEMHPELKLTPAKWTEETYLAHLGITKEQIPQELLTQKSFKHSDMWVNSVLGNLNSNSYIDPVTGEIKSTEGLVNPYGLINSEGKLIQEMGTRPVYGSGVWTQQARTALQGTDIGSWTATGRISDYIVDPRTTQSKAAEIAKAAIVFRDEGKLPEFPLMKEVRVQIAQQFGTMPIETKQPEPVSVASVQEYLDPTAKLNNEQMILLARVIEQGLIDKDAKVTDITINKEDNTYNISSYTPQSAKEAFAQLKSEGKVPDYAYIVDSNYQDGSWVFQLGDNRKPEQVFEEMVNSGELPQGSKMLGFTGTNGQYSFEYEPPETQLSKAVKQDLTKYEYYDGENKEWKIDVAAYAYDQWNSGKKYDEIISGLKEAKYDDQTLNAVMEYVPKTNFANDNEFKNIVANPQLLNQYKQEFPNDPRLYQEPGAPPRYMFGTDTYAKAVAVEKTIAELDFFKAFQTATGQFNDWVVKEQIIDKAVGVAKALEQNVTSAKMTNSISKVLPSDITATLQSLSDSMNQSAGIPPLMIYQAIRAGTKADIPLGTSVLADAGQGVYELNNQIDLNGFAEDLTAQARKSLITELTKGKTELEIQKITADTGNAFQGVDLVAQGAATLLAFAKFRFVDMPIVGVAATLDMQDGRISKAVDKAVTLGTGLVFFPVQGLGEISGAISKGQYGKAAGLAGGAVLGFVHTGKGKLPEKTIELSDGTKARIELNDVRRQSGTSVKRAGEVAMTSAEGTVKAYITRQQLDVPFKVYDNVTGATYTVKLAKGKPSTVDVKYTVEYDVSKGANKASLDNVFKRVDEVVQATVAKDGVLKKQVVEEYAGVKVTAEPVVATISSEVARLQKDAQALRIAEENLRDTTAKFSKMPIDYKGEAMVTAEMVQQVGNRLTEIAKADFAQSMQNIKLKEPMEYNAFEKALEQHLSAATKAEVLRVLRAAKPSSYAETASKLQYAKSDYLKSIRKFKDSFNGLTEGLTVKELTSVGKEIGKPELPTLVEKYNVLLKELTDVETQLAKDQALFKPDEPIGKGKEYFTTQEGLQVEGFVTPKAEAPKTGEIVTIKEQPSILITEPTKKYSYNTIPRQDGKIVETMQVADGLAEIKITTTEGGKYALSAELISNSKEPVTINGEKIVGSLKYGDKIRIGDVQIDWFPVDLYIPANAPFDIVIRAEGTKQWLDKNLERLATDREGVVADVGQQLGLNIIDLKNATNKELGFFLGNLVNGSAKDIPAGVKNIVVGHAESVGGGRLAGGKTIQEFVNENVKPGEDVLAVVCDEKTARYMGRAEGKIVKSEISKPIIKEEITTEPMKPTALQRFEKMSEEEFNQLATTGQTTPFENMASTRDKSQLKEVEAVKDGTKPVAYISDKGIRDSAREMGLETQKAHDMMGSPAWIVYKKGDIGVVNKFIEFREKWGITGERLPDQVIESIGKNPKYHIEYGELLGYKDADIAFFINNEYIGGYEGLKSALAAKGESTGWDLFVADKGKTEGAGLLSLEKDGVIRTEIPLGNEIRILSTIPPGVNIPTSIKIVFPEGQQVSVNGKPVLSGSELKYGSYIRTADRKVWFEPKEISPENLSTQFAEGMAKESKKGKVAEEPVIEEHIIETKSEVIIEEPRQGVMEFDVTKSPKATLVMVENKARQLEFNSKFKEVSRLRKELEETSSQISSALLPKGEYKPPASVNATQVLSLFEKDLKDINTEIGRAEFAVDKAIFMPDSQLREMQSHIKELKSEAEAIGYKIEDIRRAVEKGEEPFIDQKTIDRVIITRSEGGLTGTGKEAASPYGAQPKPLKEWGKESGLQRETKTKKQLQVLEKVEEKPAALFDVTTIRETKTEVKPEISEKEVVIPKIKEDVKEEVKPKEKVEVTPEKVAEPKKNTIPKTFEMPKKETFVPARELPVLDTRRGFLAIPLQGEQIKGIAGEFEQAENLPSEYPQLEPLSTEGGTKKKVKTISIAAPAQSPDEYADTESQTEMQQKLQTKTLTATQIATATKPAVEPLTKVKLEAKTKLKTKTKTTTIIPTKTTIKTPPVKKPPPGKTTILLPPEVKFKELTNDQKLGAIAWKQGFLFKVIFPPYSQHDVINSRKPIQGVKYYKGVGSAAASIITVYGDIPAHIKLDMGIVDIDISRSLNKRKPNMKFIPDPKQKTTYSGIVTTKE